MANEERDQRFLRFARAIALVSGAALPLGATVPACAETTTPPVVDAGLAADVSQPGIFIDAGISVQDAGVFIDAGVDAPGTRDAGITFDPDVRDGIAVDAPPPGLRIDDVPGADGDAEPADAAARDVPTIETTGGPMMPPEFDEARA
jgi:hypothetical protein